MIGGPPLPVAIEEYKVFVTLKTGHKFFGKVYVKAGERVQDLLNDKRAFIPILKHMDDRGTKREDVWKLIVVNKTSIESIEER